MQIYEEKFRNELSDSYVFTPHLSLLELLEIYKSLPNKDIPNTSLELGCGGGLHLNRNTCFREVEGLEVSKTAADFLTHKYQIKVYHCDFLDFEPLKKWDLLFDAHLLHCLIGVNAFKEYFKKVFDLLNPHGHLVLEVMCEGRGMSFDANQNYDIQSKVLFEGDIPIRTILSSREIEQIICESGLKIVYLRVDENIKFIPNSHRSESRPSDPDRMRIICLKE
ncbi:class I SAM-dependent methyltransferase [Halobacteriovorax sp. JY17]|uniref:class I SAM-dependent methyltransferase n=1 Tax=Halobacteriovorax sp. JY17 TaxID=2014617 RepID=UPI000C59D42B|nr:class I SAM-dependent methyltransferase [Halobacteriovorax sp. JY17]PIK15442.1 MAG: hypothetical protein CES88_01615 [Halobacteriovorax sp. JY17]